MIPNQKQQETLKAYLRDTLYYRETYEEVYDHILSALADRSFASSFQEAVNQIINEDFGGYQRLTEMEQEARNAVLQEGINNYMRYFGSQFKGTRIITTLLMGVAAYLFAIRVALGPITVEMVFLLLIVLPRTIGLFRYYRIGYLFRDKKSSIKDVIYNRITMVPIRLFLFFHLAPIAMFNFGLNFWTLIRPFEIALLILFGWVYLQAFIRLYGDEFKMNVIA